MTPARVVAVLDRRRSNAAQPHRSNPNHKPRAARERAARKDQENQR